MDNNFAGQNFNGCSFRGQDLRGADFSDCQLRSCDFTGADLTDAKLCGATMGINSQRNILKWILAFMLGIASGFLAWIINYISITALDEIYSYLAGNSFTVKNYHLLIFGSIFAISASLAVFVALKYRNWGIVGWYLLVIISSGAVIAATAEMVATASSGNGTLAAAAAGAGMVTAAVVAIAAGAGAAVIAIIVAVMEATLELGMRKDGALVAASVTFIFLFLGWYLNRQSIQFEETMLKLFRWNMLFFHCWGGTQFAGAVLVRTDFNDADLASTRFTGAKFQHPDFTGAKNLHLGWTYQSSLEHKAVRLLLTGKKLESHDFSYLNLRGLSFKGLDLSQCNFYHADLSEADFSGCDLTDTDFSKAMVYGARFSHAKMTGAIIDNWGMDKHTQFDNVECEFVFTKRNKEERNPPGGTFKPGEFSKLYQEIANTVDFIAHSPDELQALLRAIDHIKQEGGDIVIQSLERKNESVVVRTQSDEHIDKAAIYVEVKAQTEKELLVLQQEKQLLLQKVEMQEQHTDTLKALLNKAIEGPKIMNDNSRHYSNISAHSSAVNLGDDSTVSNHIEQVADAELKAALQTLLQLLADSHLPVIDKQEAHKAVDDLAAISQKPEAERKSLARRSLAFLKDLQQDLSSAAELGEQYGKLLLKVMTWF